MLSKLLQKKPELMDVYMGVVNDGIGGFPLAGLAGALLLHCSSPKRSELLASSKVW
jgi:hypothetical protein